MYVELIEKSIKNRGRIVSINEVKIQPFAFERYISMFPFTKDILEYVKVNGTIRGYQGDHYCPMCVIDIDSDDLYKAQQDAISFIQHLVNKYKIHTEGIRIYFSGKKGFHVAIPLNVAPSQDIAERCKNFVAQIVNIDVDMAIYEPHRIIRMPNSINQKSGLYKIPLTFDELKKDIAWILETAKQPKEIKYKKIPNGLSVLFERIKPAEKAAAVGDFIFDIPEKGNRNNLLFKSACKLFDKGLSSNDVYKLVNSLNLNCKTPLPSYEILTLVSSAEHKTGVRQATGFKSFGFYTQEWYDLTRPESNVLYLGFETFDKEMRGKLRGKLCIITHYGGTRKSLLAQNIAFFNIMNYGQKVAYSSMEMGVKDLCDRFVDMIITGSDKNPHYEIELREKVTPGLALKVMENTIAPKYNDHLYISFNSSMDVEKYRKTLQDLQNEGVNIDIFIVDGLNMMKGATTEDIDKHTKGLKEIAKEFNVFVMLIAHVSRGLKKDTRDVSSQARGSEKIIDNCDFYICPSLLSNPNPDSTDEFYHDKGFLRLVNKRGTGNVKDIIYELDTIRLLMTESNEKPKVYIGNKLEY